MAARRVGHPRAVSRRPSETVAEWTAAVDGVLRLQHNYLSRLADYTTRAQALTTALSVDPTAWIKNYTDFLTGVVSDTGDWVLEREGLSLRAAVPSFHVHTDAESLSANRNEARPIRPTSVRTLGAMATLRGNIRANEGMTSVKLHVPAAVFVNVRGRQRHRELTLMTDGLFLDSRGTPLTGTHVRFEPPTVTPSRREADLNISDTADVVRKGARYRGLVWLKETRQVIAAVEIDVL